VWCQAFCSRPWIQGLLRCPLLRDLSISSGVFFKIFRCFVDVKKLHEPPLIATFWPHALLQMLTLMLYLLLLEPRGYLHAVQVRLADLELSVGWGLPFSLWLVFVFLLVEVITRQSQRFAASIFPFQKLSFVFLSALVAIPALYLTFVGMECVLSFVALGRYPVYFGPIYFRQGFWLTVLNDWPILLIMGAGEISRHILYRSSIGQWHHERGLRLLPEIEKDDL
jgi:hypothetical protein